MGGSISIDTLTDEQIERISIQRMKSVGKVGLVGSTDPNHAEIDSRCECAMCRNGVDLDKAGKAVCLRCSRGSKAIDRMIRSVKREETVLKALQARETVSRIKLQAIEQMRRTGRGRGRKPDPARVAVVKDAIRAALAKREA